VGRVYRRREVCRFAFTNSHPSFDHAFGPFSTVGGQLIWMMMMGDRFRWPFTPYYSQLDIEFRRRETIDTHPAVLPVGFSFCL
jgi:hypothetical protein